MPNRLQIVQAISDYIQDAILITTAEPLDPPDGPRIVYANAAFQRMTGWGVTEIIGQTPRVLQAPESDRAELRRVRDALRNWRPIRAVLLNQTKAGARFWVEIDIVPVSDPSGRVVHWVSVQRDVTERVNQQKSIERELSRVQAAEAAKTQFLATISHELRTPLNAILGFGEALALGIPGPLEPKQLDYVSSIRHAAGHLRDLINDILDMTQVEAGRLAVTVETVRVDVIMAEVAPMLTQEALGAKVALSATAPPELAARADPLRLRQVLLILCGNAIHYAGAGSRVEISAWREAETVTIRIADDGRGMSKSELGHAMSPFNRGTHAGLSSRQGIGLGLPLSVALIEAQAGAIKIESAPRQGTVVTISLPAA